MVRSLAVLGAGNGGLAAAAHLTLRGFEVRLMSRSADRLSAIRDRGGIEAQGPHVDGFASVHTVTTDIREAVTGADLVMLTVPAPALAQYAGLLAPVLAPGQPVFLNPGGTGGALAFSHALQAAGHDHPRVCESSTLAYACRTDGPTTVRISNVVPALPFAAFPGQHLEELADLVSEPYPAITPVKNVLETGLANINAIEHPAQILMNTGWIEHTKGDFYFYYEGTTPAVGAVIDAVDAERLGVATALGVAAEPFVELFARAGYTTAEAAESGSAYQALQASEPNRWFRSPATIDHRYVHEDVGYGLVPWSLWAGLAGILTPVIDGLIAIASAATGTPYRERGLTLERMGLAEVSDAQQLQDVLARGAVEGAS